MVIAVARSIVLYLIIVLGIRLLGKHQVSELEPAEFVLALIIADVASVPMQDYGIPLLMGVIPIITLLCLSMILSVLTLKSLKLRAILNGVPSILIQDGRIDQKELRRNRMTLDELLEELRLQGHTDLTAIRCAVLETNGQLSVLPYACKQPPSAEDMGLSVPEKGPALMLISDGQLISANLDRCGLDRQWLQEQLNKHGVSTVENVFLLTVDTEQKTYFIKKEKS